LIPVVGRFEFGDPLMTLADLMKVLNGVGKLTELYRSPDGSVALMLPYGGRILGLFSPQSEEDFFGTHPALSSVESARRFYERAAWHNSRGDRTWLSPEVYFFFPDFPNLRRYRQPLELDPGNYRVIEAGAGARMVNRATLTLSRSQERIELEIVKSVSPAANPLRYEKLLGESEDVEYARYTLQVSLEIMKASARSSARVGIWNLLQMPHGGELLIPTYVRVEPKAYFGTIPPGDLSVGDRLIRYRMGASGEQKIGVRAVATTGRGGYLYETGHRSLPIIHNFSVNPSGEYIDVPWKETEDYGCAFQACNVNSARGNFSELEYHVPAIGYDTWLRCCQDTSQVRAFRGSGEQIQRVARSLLSPHV